MGMLENLFSFKSKEQLEKERIEFENQIFPLGVDATREKILAALRPFFRAKADATEILFPFLMAKQSYLEGKLELGEIIKKIEKSAFKVKDEQARAVLALVLLDQSVTSLDAYPTTQDVAARAAELQF